MNKDFQENFDPEKKPDRRRKNQAANILPVDYDEEFFKLNVMQRKFVEIFLLCGELKKAARAAGYAYTNAGQIGKVLYETPKIKSIIQHKQKEAASVARISKEKLLITLENKRVKADLEDDINTLTKMTAEISKLMGFYEQEDKAALDVLKTGKIKISFGDKKFNPDKKLNKEDPLEGEDIKWDYRLDDESEDPQEEEEDE